MFRKRLDRRRENRASETERKKERKDSHDQLLDAILFEIDPCEESTYNQYDNLVKLILYETLRPGSAIYGDKQLAGDVRDANAVVEQHRHALLHTDARYDRERQRAVVVAIACLGIWTKWSIEKALKKSK
jgi:hypothetical protein